MSVLHANIIDLTREIIDLTEEGVQDMMDLIQQNQPQYHHLNGYDSDDGFVVAPGEGESEIDDDEDMANGFVLPDFFFGDEDEDNLPQDDQDDQSQDDQPQNILQPQQNQPHGYVHSECSICLENVTEGDEGGNVTILTCGHTFHNVCMTSWILFKEECPMCKGTIEGAQSM